MNGTEPGPGAVLIPPSVSDGFTLSDTSVCPQVTLRAFSKYYKMFHGIKITIFTGCKMVLMLLQTLDLIFFSNSGGYALGSEGYHRL